ncbi:MAG: restriction endonuclease subunit S [Gammaproteobacteria bacterium]|nr:restriction endonuclease subunit S [Gammaproteobacteria bacterium]
MSAVVERVQTVQQDNLPQGWRLVTIVDLVGDGGVFVDGDWVESKDQDPVGNVRLIQLADIGDGQYRNKSARFLTHTKAIELGCTFLKKGDVLIARMPDPLGRACIFPGDSKPAVTVVDVAIVRSATGEFDHHWLMYFVNAPAFRSVIASMQSGSTRKRISRGNLAKITLPVPPLDQQKLIVAEIEKQFSRLDEAVANLKRVKANLKRYKAAVLNAAVEGRLVETEAEIARREGRDYETGEQLLQRILETRRKQWKGKGKYKEPAAQDTTDLPELPEGWVWASLDQLSWVSSYGTSAKCAYENKGPPVLRIPNVDKAAIDLADVKYAPSDLTVAKEEALSPGDMLIIRTNGSKSLIGRAAVVTTQLQRPTTYASYLIRFRLLGDAALSAWVLSYWQSYSSRSWIESKAATSAGQHNISMSVLATASVPLPPVVEQDRIVAEVDRRLSLIRETEAQVDANLLRAERLRQSILSRGFSGGLGDSASNTFKAAQGQH